MSTLAVDTSIASVQISDLYAGIDDYLETIHFKVVEYELEKEKYELLLSRVTGGSVTDYEMVGKLGCRVQTSVKRGDDAMIAVVEQSQYVDTLKVHLDMMIKDLLRKSIDAGVSTIEKDIISLRHFNRKVYSYREISNYLGLNDKKAVWRLYNKAIRKLDKYLF